MVAHRATGPGGAARLHRGRSLFCYKSLVTDRTWVLAPNDLALWDQCRRCFYLAAAAEFPRPASPNRATSLIGRRLLSGLQGARADKTADGMPAGPVAVTGVWRWTEIPRDEAAVYGCVAEALSVVAEPAPPGGTPLCTWCVYRDASRRTGYQYYCVMKVHLVSGGRPQERQGSR